MGFQYKCTSKLVCDSCGKESEEFDMKIVEGEVCVHGGDDYSQIELEFHLPNGFWRSHHHVSPLEESVYCVPCKEKNDKSFQANKYRVRAKRKK